MITIIIYNNDELKNVITKTLWEFSEWYRSKVANEEVDRWYNESASRFIMYMKNGRKYIIEGGK